MRTLKVDLVAAQLAKTKGNISAAARAFRVDRSTLAKFIAGNKRLEQVLRDAREEMIDVGESSLFRAVSKGEPWAVCFTLKTQGKSRGYVERTEHEHTGRDGGPIEIAPLTADERLAAIARIIESARGAPTGQSDSGATTGGE